jgi:hypothetical protein
MTSAADVRTVVFGALQQGACSIPELMTELIEGPAARRRLFRGVLAEAADGVRSAAEHDFQRLLSRAMVPRPVFNARLYTLDGEFIAMVDGWWGGRSKGWPARLTRRPTTCQSPRKTGTGIVITS